MSNAEWKDLISKEFGVSKSLASKMLHAMYEVKRVKILSESYDEGGCSKKMKTNCNNCGAPVDSTL